MAEDKNLDQDYDKAGFGGALAFGKKPALLLIDFAKAYITKDCGLYAGVEDSAAAAIKLLAAARDAGIMIVYTRVEFTPGGADGGVFYRKVPALKNFDRGNPMAEFVDGLEPRDDEVVITKQYASAFFGTNLASTLAADGIDTLLISGWSTSGCVRASTLDACQSGFIPIVVREAVGDRDVRPHESNLFDLQAKYAEVKGMDDVFAYLKGL
ncbi:MAG: isochorismatase family protein [Rhodospirillaceae bacterium]|jgi:maleamate amidohydrolase|nr:isochorismatase family protein [Rhodospirillaceae bacterium]MBT5240728.1 isochorismatase family protein [Rhodospirillaceae bacterium]MBT5564082.1 isochorismatase family protein [Rhodospirillaceae bacterium]MBT6091028.1 isochorismatase family protein [Rhodospirillaceae bacterium]MBT6960044.1 isochorismatase family protein [Rhodospirillaceae bacterium]